MQSFNSIIDLWPTPAALAADIGQKADTVRKWRQRDSIPADCWLSLIQAARRRDYPVTATLLAQLADKSASVVTR